MMITDHVGLGTVNSSGPRRAFSAMTTRRTKLGSYRYSTGTSNLNRYRFKDTGGSRDTHESDTRTLHTGKKDTGGGETHTGHTGGRAQHEHSVSITQKNLCHKKPTNTPALHPH